jgi:hypothetical protein
MSDSPVQDPTPPLDFRTAYCLWTGCSPAHFEKRVLAQTLFLQARLLRFLVRPFRSHAFYAEFLLVKQAGDKQQLADIELDVDFYQHKHVVGSLARESFALRVSGRQLVRLARGAFRAARQMQVREEVEILPGHLEKRPDPA